MLLTGPWGLEGNRLARRGEPGALGHRVSALPTGLCCLREREAGPCAADGSGPSAAGPGARSVQRGAQTRVHPRAHRQPSAGGPLLSRGPQLAGQEGLGAHLLWPDALLFNDLKEQLRCQVTVQAAAAAEPSQEREDELRVLGHGQVPAQHLCTGAGLRGLEAPSRLLSPPAPPALGWETGAPVPSPTPGCWGPAPPASAVGYVAVAAAGRQPPLLWKVALWMVGASGLVQGIRCPPHSCSQSLTQGTRVQPLPRGGGRFKLPRALGQAGHRPRGSSHPHLASLTPRDCTGIPAPGSVSRDPTRPTGSQAPGSPEGRPGCRLLHGACVPACPKCGRGQTQGLSLGRWGNRGMEGLTDCPAA